MAAEVHSLVVRDVFATQAYFVVDGDSGGGVLIDPGAQPDLICEVVERRGWHIEKILLTHGHFDHTGAVDGLVKLWGIPTLAHIRSQDYLENAELNLSAQFGRDVRPTASCILEDGDIIEAAEGSVRMRVLHVPGHTLDSCVFYLREGNLAFVGDTVYEGGPGLTWYPTGDESLLLSSTRRKVLTLPPETVLLSGHSAPITVRQLSARMAVR